MKLAEQRCLPLQEPHAMTAYEVGKHLGMVSGWARVDGAIEKTFAFAGYAETIAFVNAAAWVAQREGHHPELAVSVDRCAVRFHTAAVGGLTLNDFICAAKLDALVT
jgi:4a-hydroxytetrahydrobiopterin dehydratase